MGVYEAGWGQSTVSPSEPANPDSAIQQHNNGMGEFQIKVASAANTNYAKWAALATTAPTSSAAPTSTAAPTPTISGIAVSTATSYDYVIVGGGAGGLPMADKLSAAGHSVLLIEKGVASSARYGGSEFQSSL